MDIGAAVREHLTDFPLDLPDILRACIATEGLAQVLEAIGELFGDSGMERRKKPRRSGIRRTHVPQGESNGL